MTADGGREKSDDFSLRITNPGFCPGGARRATIWARETHWASGKSKSKPGVSLGVGATPSRHRWKHVAEREKKICEERTLSGVCC